MRITPLAAAFAVAALVPAVALAEEPSPGMRDPGMVASGGLVLAAGGAVLAGGSFWVNELVTAKPACAPPNVTTLGVAASYACPGAATSDGSELGLAVASLVFGAGITVGGIVMTVVGSRPLPAAPAKRRRLPVPDLCVGPGGVKMILTF
jgi:hypothetical protein